MKIWSAIPTPLTENLQVDEDSMARSVEASVRDSVDGLFVAGTCGEGPWLTDKERAKLLGCVVRSAAGRLKIAMQVSDNSVPRILENMKAAAAGGADYAIIAAPAFLLNATEDRVAAHFLGAIDASPLPVGIYDLGKHRQIVIPEDRLGELYRHPKVAIIKDSSGSESRRVVALAARAQRPELVLLNGDEFRCIEYMEAGYDGVMFGGAVMTARQLRRIGELLSAGRREEAAALDAEVKRRLYGVYGGESILCWLTGLKYWMVRAGLFEGTASYLGYPLHEECKAFVEADAALHG